jgi:Lanthionine synthetase C-like protein
LRGERHGAVRPNRHEPLNARPWDEQEARAVIDRIVADTISRGAEQLRWPAHPLDSEGGGQSELFGTLYLGSVGVIWALDYLHNAGATERNHAWPALSFPQVQEQGPPNWRPSPHSYFMGDSSQLLLRWKLRRDPALAEQLAASIASNIDDTTVELMWSNSGTMLAALFMHDWTGEQRWRDLFVQGAEKLWSQLEPGAGADCRMWTQNLYGNRIQLLGAVHGFASNAFAIIKGFRLLSEERRVQWRGEILKTLSATAVHDGMMCNWRPVIGAVRPERDIMLVQHCHGAPGMIVCLAGLDVKDDAFDRLLAAGGELTWAAGPLIKGSNLCHGTGGNGYAFLKLYERNGDDKWLSRARSFAMHAIGQFEAHAKQYDQLRYSLWTGDPGLAVYLWDCIHGQARFPTMDVF